MDDISFIPMGPEHYDRVLDFWMTMEGQGLRTFPEECDSRESFARYVVRNPGMSFVAFAGDDLIGTVQGGHDGRRGYIYHLAVHPDYRGRGLAEALVERSVEALKKEGLSRVHAILRKDNDSGNEFWEKQGYVVQEEVEILSKYLRGTKP